MSDERRIPKWLLHAQNSRLHFDAYKFFRTLGLGTIVVGAAVGLASSFFKEDDSFLPIEGAAVVCLIVAYAAWRAFNDEGTKSQNAALEHMRKEEGE